MFQTQKSCISTLGLVTMTCLDSSVVWMMYCEGVMAVYVALCSISGTDPRWTQLENSDVKAF
jgi:hypothetical protein